MKNQFKYAFLSGLYVRGQVFAVIFVMNTVFIMLGSLGSIPFAAHITFVSLGGTAIAVMLAANIAGDAFIIRRMFSAPEAYLYALTPVPRRKTLLASVTAMTVMDLLTMVIVVVFQVFLSFNMIGNGIYQTFWDNVYADTSLLIYALWFILMLIAAYLLLIMIILFCVTAKKSIFFNLPASGLLAFLLACGCFYAVSLLQLVLIPVSEVRRFGMFILITPFSEAAFPLVILLTLLEAFVLFAFTSKLLERRINL
jgi:hypothetical protein